MVPCSLLGLCVLDGPTLPGSGAVLVLLRPDSWVLGHVGLHTRVGGLPGQCYDPPTPAQVLDNEKMQL